MYKILILMVLLCLPITSFAADNQVSKTKGRELAAKAKFNDFLVEQEFNEVNNIIEQVFKSSKKSKGKPETYKDLKVRFDRLKENLSQIRKVLNNLFRRVDFVDDFFRMKGN